MELWGQTIPPDATSPEEFAYLQAVAARYPTLPSLEQMWALLDEVWIEKGASAGNPDTREVHEYYRHPVWLVNGIFAETHAESREHRRALARYIAREGRPPIVDFGGGYGGLARQIAAVMPDARISIVDPFPSGVAVRRNADASAIAYVPSMPAECGTVIAQDVLEHVSDPVGLAALLVRSTRIGGLLVFANCFEPCIQCHLPQTFHLKKTFARLMRLLGCEPLGAVPGCEHALVFRRRSASAAPPAALRLFERYSQARAWVRKQRQRLRGR